jgi:hypothetical protein
VSARASRIENKGIQPYKQERSVLVLKSEGKTFSPSANAKKSRDSVALKTHFSLTRNPFTIFQVSQNAGSK